MFTFIAIIVVLLIIAIVAADRTDRNKERKDQLERQRMSEALDRQIQTENNLLEDRQLQIETKFNEKNLEPIEFHFNGLPYKFDEDFYTAFDFETADDNIDSIIKLSIAHFQGNKLLEIKEYYFSPLNEPNTKDDQFKYTHIHGIRPSQLQSEATILDKWDEIEPQLNGKHLIAHNIEFDVAILRNILTHVGRSLSKCTITCTSYYSKLFIKWMHTLKLDLICKEHRIPFWKTPSKFKAVSTGILFMYLSTIATRNSFDLFITGKKISLKPNQTN